MPTFLSYKLAQNWAKKSFRIIISTIFPTSPPEYPLACIWHSLSVIFFKYLGAGFWSASLQVVLIIAMIGSIFHFHDFFTSFSLSNSLILAYLGFPFRGFSYAYLQVVAITWLAAYYTFTFYTWFRSLSLSASFLAYGGRLSCRGFWSGCLQVVLVGAIIGSYFTLSIMAALSLSSSWKLDASRINIEDFTFNILADVTIFGASLKDTLILK